MDNDTAPTLRLEITKGPREGEAHEFKPGKKVGIGRLVKGNAIQIKDNGISSKHLLIEFDYSLGKWGITDLESSNGTILNDVALDPLVPRVLNDGDVVKIGEVSAINVKFQVKVENVRVVVGESNVRRNPRRRAAVKAVVSESVDVVGLRHDLEEEEKKVMVRGRKGVTKKNGLKKVDEESREELGVVYDSDVEVEKKVDQVLETGRRRARTKKVDVLTDVNCNEGVKDEVQVVKKTRGRRCRVLKERNDEDQCDVDKNVEAASHVVEASRGGKGGLRNLRPLNKKSLENESGVVGGKCDQPAQSVPSEDGVKKGSHGTLKSVQSLDNEVDNKLPEEKDNADSLVETHGNLVNIKREKFSIYPSLGPVNQVSHPNSHERLPNSEVENAIEFNTFEQLEEADIHLSLPIQEKLDVTRSFHENKMENSSNGIHPNSQNIKQEKKSIPPLQENITEDICVKGSEVEFSHERYSNKDVETRGVRSAADNLAGVETRDSLEVAGVHPAVVMDTEMIDSDANECQEMPAEPGCHSEGCKEFKLEEMTLGDWFDYLEVYLPKQIHDSTEEMIASMIQKSKRFQEYVSQQQKEKGKVLAP